MKNHDTKDTELQQIKDVTKTMVDAWAANTPKEMNIVQNFNAGGAQVKPVETTSHDKNDFLNNLNPETEQPYIPPRDSGGK